MRKTAAKPETRPPARKSRKQRGSEARVDAAVTPEVSAALARFRVVFSSVRAHNRRILEQCGAGALHVRALAVIAVHPGIGVSALARSLLIHQPSASRLVDDLVEQGLAERQRSTRDARAVELSIAPRGRKVLARAPDPLMGVLPDAVGRLSPARLRALHALLGELLDLMRERVDSAQFEPLVDT